MNYVIEQAVVKSNLATPSSVGYWEPVTRNLPVHEASDGSTGYIYDIINLASEKYMLFRVAAQNKQGIGEFEAITSPLLVTSPHSKLILKIIIFINVGYFCYNLWPITPSNI